MTDTNAAADVNAAAAAAASAAAAAAAKATPWHAGVEPEILGHWQNKGWKTDDPKEVALAATKQAREAEKFFGVPPDQILKMPKADAKPEDVAAFWQRLGAGKEAKDYDFSSIKTASGDPIPAALADAIRTAALGAYVPKDAAAKLAQAVVKQLDDARAAETTVTQAKVDQEKADLKKNWGNNYDFNLLKAMEGVRRLGITPDAVKAIEGQIGYAAVMDAMRKIGAGTSEDTFVERGAGGGPGPTTQAGAVARKAELMADKAWVGRFLANGTQERLEMAALDQLITGVVA